MSQVYFVQGPALIGFCFVGSLAAIAFAHMFLYLLEALKNES